MGDPPRTTPERADEEAAKRRPARQWRLSPPPRPESPMLACASCGRTFSAARSDARYCSGRCRVRAFRARLASKIQGRAENPSQ
jgi:hypothetical protein